MRLPRVVVCLLFVGSYVCSSLAQSPNGTVTGLVLDPAGQAIVAADVLLINDVTGVKYSGKTNIEGIYVFSNVPPGPYRLQVAKPGFKTLIKPDIILNVQDALSINFNLPIGATMETITVQGGASLVNTETAAVSTVVDRRFVENMPLNGRSFQALITLTPGVVLTPTSAGEQGQFSVNGQRADANYLTVDGVSANISAGGGSGLRQAAVGTIPGTSALGGTNNLVSVDAMQEFRVQTSSFAPEFGRTPGGQISIATRSGTNLLHGTAFDYFRNDVMDANDWFGNHNDLPRPNERQNDFGGVLGGPIVQNKTFFFVSYEGLRLRQPQTQTSIVPTTASRQQASPGMQPFFNAYPLPNGADLGNGVAAFNASFSNPSSLDAYSVRVDHMISASVTLFGRYSYSPSNAVARGPIAELNNALDTDVRTHTLTLGSIQSLRPTINNEVRLNCSNLKTLSVFQIDDFGGAVPPPASLLFPAGFSADTGLFALVINGAGGFDIGRNGINEQRQLNAVDNLAIAFGSHQLKFGVDYRWLAPITSPFSYLQSALFLDMNSALSGMPLAAIVEAERGVGLLNQNFSLYAQDTWKATARLNLTYGLRWELNPAPSGKNSMDELLTVLNLNDPANITLAPRGTPLYETTHRNFAPRLGFDYQLTKTSGRETVLRAGVGTFYDIGSGSLASAANEFPFVAQNVLFGVPFPLTPQQAAPPGISATPPVTGNFYVADPKLKLPRTYQWNLTLEQAIGRSQTLSVAYVGAAGRDLLRQDTIAFPNLDFQTVFVTRNSATSDYDAMQIKFQRRLSRGLQTLASYALSHAIDVASNDSGSFNAPPSVGSKLDRGNSDFDIRHVLTLAASYDLPTAGEPLFHRLLGSWSLDSLLTARSATPVNLSGPFFLVGSAEFNARPNVVPGMPFYLHGSQYPGGKAFNSAAFVDPPNGSQGNLGRNVLRGFGAWQADLAIRRQFHLTDKVGLQFRAEAFNVFNHPNFGNPAASLSDPLFGRSTESLANSLVSSQGGFNGGLNPLYQFGGPRSLQLALKMQF